MTSKLRDGLARQLRLPTGGPLGWFVLQWLKFKNTALEKNAARLCNIQPDHRVLEVGFGPGIGLEEAVKYIKDGPGKIYGVELSTYMLETAMSTLSRVIHDGKVELTFGSVEHLPYSSAFFDRIFHCNCYYFWPSMQQALSELGRVLKPGGVMVTVLNLDSLRVAVSRGLMNYGNPDPVKYMCALELMGFTDVKMEYFTEGSLKYQAIFAHLPRDESPVDLTEAQMAAEQRDSQNRTF